MKAPSRPRLDFVNSPAIRYFFAVAEARSFRGAAEQIGIAASAIHRQIGLLEKQLRVSLLLRGRGREGVRLTSAGELLVYRLRLAMHQVGVALEEIEGIRGAAAGKIVVGTTDALAQDVFPTFLQDFRKRHPNVGIEMRILDRRGLIEALIENHLDVALAFDLPIRLGFRIIDEFQMTPSALVPRDHPLARKPQTTLGECAQYPLALSIEGENVDGMLAQMYLASRIRPKIVLTTNSFVMMRNAVIANLAISVQTKLRGAFENRDPRLTYVPLKDAMARYSVLSCSVPTGRQLTVAASAFVGQLTDALREQLLGDTRH